MTNESKDAYVNWRGIIPVRITRHHDFLRMKMPETDAKNLQDIVNAIEGAEASLKNHADAKLQSEVTDGKEYVKQLANRLS